MVIIMFRALVLNILVLGIPAFAVYYIIVLPLQAQVFTREIAAEWRDSGLAYPTKDVLILMVCLQSQYGRR
jgi:hypothetical protein